MSPVLTRAAARRWRAALVLLAVFPVATPSGAQIECLPLNAPYSELVRTYGDDYLFANAFLEVLSAGSVSLPWIDPITAELIAIDLREGNYLSAATRAYDWGEGKAMTLLAGPVVGAMVTAMRVGEALGMNRWEWRHAEVFDRAYSDLARLSPEYWPEDLRSFRRQTTEETRVIFEHHLPFMGNYVQATLPGPRWWRPTLTESERNERAYQALRAHALLEAALDAEGLQGADRTPERLQEILSERLRTQTEAEITRALVARQASACSDQPVAAPEPDPPAPGPTWQDHPDPLAAAAEPEPDPPLATLPTTPDPIPAPAVEPDALAGPLVVSLLATERTSADTTTFRVEITNISGATVAGFRPSVQPERVPASGGHGTGFAFGEGVRDLDPGESVTLIFFGTGDIGAVHLDLMVGGAVLGSQRFGVAHADRDVRPTDSTTLEHPTPADGWISIPAEFRGTFRHRVVITIPGLSGRPIETECATRFVIHQGRWQVLCLNTPRSDDPRGYQTIIHGLVAWSDAGVTASDLKRSIEERIPVASGLDQFSGAPWSLDEFAMTVFVDPTRIDIEIVVNLSGIFGTDVGTSRMQTTISVSRLH